MKKKITEKLIIQKFAGIQHMDFNLKSMNIFIGPSGSGKSITIKLIYFFKGIFDIFISGIINTEDISKIEKSIIDKFIDFFPTESWGEDNFIIEYIIGEVKLVIKRNKEENLTFEYSENLNQVFISGQKLYKSELNKVDKEVDSLFSIDFKTEAILRDKITNIFSSELGEEITSMQFFIPSGRSFFANLQNSIFSILKGNKNIDPFLIEFGSIYERFKSLFELNLDRNKNLEKIIIDILNSHYTKDKKGEFLVHEDGRKVRIEYASSGQQESLPILIMLSFLSNFRGNQVIYIEEPEAHLFPTAQKKIVEFLAFIKNNLGEKTQLFITTHSPYILSSFNNLIYAGSNYNIKGVDDIVSKELWLDYDIFSAYSLSREGRKDIFDHEFNLIGASVIDEVSDSISDDFNQVMELKNKYFYENEKDR